EHVMASLRFAFSLAFGLLGVPAWAQAGGTRSHQVVDFSDFDQGETDGAAIESEGRVTVGYAPVRTALDAMTAFSCVGHRNHVYVATADKASIVRIEAVNASRPRSKKGVAPKLGV